MQQLWRALAVALLLWRAPRLCCRAAGAGQSSPPELLLLLLLLQELRELLLLGGQWEMPPSQLSCGSMQQLPSSLAPLLWPSSLPWEGALVQGAPAPPSPVQRRMQ
jgi:hypothetical protein